MALNRVCAATADPHMAVPTGNCASQARAVTRLECACMAANRDITPGSHHSGGIECALAGRWKVLVHRQEQRQPSAAREPIEPRSRRVCATGTDIDGVRGIEGRSGSVALDQRHIREPR